MKNYNKDLEKEIFWTVFENLAINWLSLYSVGFWIALLCFRAFVGFFFPLQEMFFFYGEEFATLFFLIYFVILGLLLLAILANLAQFSKIQKVKLLWLLKATRRTQRRIDKKGTDFFWSEKNKQKYLSRLRTRRKKVEQYLYYIYGRSGD